LRGLYELPGSQADTETVIAAFVYSSPFPRGEFSNVPEVKWRDAPGRRAAIDTEP
jgi:hypothetical protein